MTLTDDMIALVAGAGGAGGAGRAGREELWTQILREVGAQTVLELGVWKGHFAENILKQCPKIARYYMLDPWRHLDHWNKPLNVDQRRFDTAHIEALSRTEFAGDRRIILRGTTIEMIDQISDGTLDMAYIDGDHTLRGIAIDLIRVYPKVRPGGLIGGDDHTPSIWQHSEKFEPTLVFPFATYFAESQGAPLVALPHDQFAIVKPTEPGNAFRVIDPSERYSDRTLLQQMRKRP